MKRVLLFIFFANATTLSFCQIKGFSVHLKVNHPVISDIKKKITSTTIIASPGYTYTVNSGTVTEKYHETPGFDFGFKYNQRLSENFFISSGLTLSLLQFNRSVVVINQATSGNYIGTGYFGSGIDNADKLGDHSARYIQLPIGVSTAIIKDRLIIYSGFTTSFLSNSSRYVGDPYLMITKDTSGDAFKKVLMNAEIQADYLFSRQFGINWSIQKSFTPIFASDEQFAGKAKYIVFALGINYSLER